MSMPEFDTYGEPLIEEMLSDPGLQLLMKSNRMSADGVREFARKQRIRILEARLVSSFKGKNA